LFEDHCCNWAVSLRGVDQVIFALLSECETVDDTLATLPYEGTTEPFFIVSDVRNERLHHFHSRLITAFLCISDDLLTARL
jgi:hypothetical protein